ncbi:MAG: XAC2610-related protein [Deinococcales bacterium]
MRKHLLLTIFCLSFGFGFAQREATYSYSLDKDIKASAPLSSRGGTIALQSSKTKKSLIVQIGATVQRFALPTLEDAPEGSLVLGDLLVEDFDFDGFNDVGIPSGIGYGGVNVFYQIQRYNPKTKRLELLEGKDFEVSNPGFDPKNKILFSSARSGPAWYGTQYKFLGGKPYRLKSEDPVVLIGFPKRETLMYQTTTYNSKGQVISTELNEQNAKGGTVPVFRAIVSAKADLYSAPNDNAKTGRYIVRNDVVRVLELQKPTIVPEEVQWAKVAYLSQKLGRIVAWLRLVSQ